MRRALLIWAVVAARAASAHADAVLEEISAGGSLSASTTPSVSWIADRIAGTWEASPRWQLRVDLGATRTMAPSAEDEGNTVFTTAASAEFAPDEHWSLSLAAGWSPASTTRSSATVLDDTLPGGLGEADAQLAARSMMMSISASIGYDTAGDSDQETSGALTIGASHFQSIQAVTSLTDPDGRMLTTRQVAEHCTAEGCSDELWTSLSPKWTQLTQVSIGASVTQTLEGNGDLGLAATCFLYDQDPTRVGYFSLATIGRDNLGAGSGVAPLRYAITPSIGDRWGALSATLALTYGIYIADLGYDLSASARIQYKLKLGAAARLKLYAKLGGSWGVDPDENPITAVSTALGAQYSW